MAAANPLRASNAYKEIVDALRNALNASETAKKQLNMLIMNWIRNQRRPWLISHYNRVIKVLI